METTTKPNLDIEEQLDKDLPCVGGNGQCEAPVMWLAIPLRTWKGTNSSQGVFLCDFHKLRHIEFIWCTYNRPPNTRYIPV